MKKRVIILIIILAVFVVAIAASCGAEKKTAPDPAQYTADPASLAALLRAVEPSAEGVTVAQDAPSVWSVAYAYAGRSVDNTGFVRNNLAAYINYCIVAYQIDGVDAVRFSVAAQTTDARGNAAQSEVFRIRMDKAAFSAYAWAEMKNRSGSFAQIEADCVECWIDPGLRADESAIFYRG